jgi:hypothetical protein
MAIQEVVDWQTVTKDNVAHHPTGPAGRDAVRASLSFQELQAAIARWRDANNIIDWTLDQGATNIHELNILTFTDIARGSVPPSGGGTINFMRADGIWAAPPNTIYSHPNHSGHVTSLGDGAQTLVVAAITGQTNTNTLTGTDEFLVNDGGAIRRVDMNRFIVGQATALTTGLAGTDEILVSDAGVIKRMDISVLEDYLFTDLLPVVQTVNTQTGAVSTGTTQILHDDSIPQNTEGDEYMTLAITPKNTNNILKIEVVFHFATTTASDSVVALFQDSTAGALAAISTHNAVINGTAVCNFSHYMTAGTVSATTFKVRAGPSGAYTMTFNGAGGGRKLGGVLSSSITITEYQV